MESEAKNENHSRAVRWIIAGAVLCVLTLAAVIYGLNSRTAVMANTAAVRADADRLMEAVRAADLETLQGMLYGAPNLGTAPERNQEPQSLIWYAYLDSIRYQPDDTVTASNETLCIPVQIQCLDIRAVTDALKEIAPDLLEKKATELGDESKIYDEAHKYRDDFVSDVLREATQQVLAQPQTPAEHTMTLQFVRSGNTWQVLPGEELTQLLSGYVTE